MNSKKRKAQADPEYTRTLHTGGDALASSDTLRVRVKINEMENDAKRSPVEGRQNSHMTDDEKVSISIADRIFSLSKGATETIVIPEERLVWHVKVVDESYLLIQLLPRRYSTLSREIHRLYATGYSGNSEYDKYSRLIAEQEKIRAGALRNGATQQVDEAGRAVEMLRDGRLKVPDENKNIEYDLETIHEEFQVPYGTNCHVDDVEVKWISPPGEAEGGHGRTRRKYILETVKATADWYSMVIRRVGHLDGNRFICLTGDPAGKQVQGVIRGSKTDVHRVLLYSREDAAGMGVQVLQESFLDPRRAFVSMAITNNMLIVLSKQRGTREYFLTVSTDDQGVTDQEAGVGTEVHYEKKLPANEIWTDVTTDGETLYILSESGSILKNRITHNGAMLHFQTDLSRCTRIRVSNFALFIQTLGENTIHVIPKDSMGYYDPVEIKLKANVEDFIVSDHRLLCAYRGNRKLRSRIISYAHDGSNPYELDLEEDRRNASISLCLCGKDMIFGMYSAATTSHDGENTVENMCFRTS
jgi:hypothetical protein